MAGLDEGAGNEVIAYFYNVWKDRASVCEPTPVGADAPPGDGQGPGDRLSRLSRASVRINASLDVEAALRAVLDGAWA